MQQFETADVTIPEAFAMPGTWTPLVNQPSFNASTMLLLTDGTVMCQNSDASDWHRLTPDASGNYVNGTWSALASGLNSPLYYASAVLEDGRVFTAGGEYDAGVAVDLLAAQIYDPTTDAWTKIATPAGWTNIGDAPSCVLPDGRVLLGSIMNNQTAIYDPAAGTWSAGGNKLNASSTEETWTLLPDQSVLTLDCNGHPNAEKFNESSNSWVTAGASVTDLVEAASIEIGPALLLPDGRVFAVGSTNQTALYTPPPIASMPGTWVAGPTQANIGGSAIGSKDAPGCLMPNGKVLFVGGPVDGVRGSYLTPSYFFEFDPTTNTIVQVVSPPTSGGPPYVGRMLLLPSGQVLFSIGSNNVQVYTPDGGPLPAWAPAITSCPAYLQIGKSYTLQGRQLNGLSQAVSYGDDAQMATNYPMVRIYVTATGQVFYCRTQGHSTMGVATGTTIQSTNFSVPPGVPNGSAQLFVVANGIASANWPVTIGLKVVKEFKVEIKEIKEIKHEKLEKVEIKEFKEIKLEKLEKAEIKEHKEFKGEKVEVKDFKEIEKLHIKEFKELEKGIVENKLKDAENEQILTNTETTNLMQLMAEHIDKMQTTLDRHSAFITQPERPTVGEIPPSERDPRKPRPPKAP